MYILYIFILYILLCIYFKCYESESSKSFPTPELVFRIIRYSVVRFFSVYFRFSADVYKVVDFMDTLSFLPTSYESIVKNLEQARLMTIQDEDLSLIDALWSVMQPLTHIHRKWHLANYAIADFKQNLDLKIVRICDYVDHVVKA